MTMKARTLYVLRVTKQALSKKWGMPIPEKHSEILYVRCNVNGEVDWDSTLMYELDHLERRGNYQVLN